jgi:hypothetical protein
MNRPPHATPLRYQFQQRFGFEKWRVAAMSSEFDILRIDNNGLTWLEPAITLDDAKARIQQRGAQEPGNYFIFDLCIGDRIMMKVQLTTWPIWP